MIASSDLKIRRHIQSYYEKLLTGSEFAVSDIYETYVQMSPSIHKNVSNNKIDIDVLNYCLNRLPIQIFSASKIIISQNLTNFSSMGYDLSMWQPVSAKSRRRRCYVSPDGNTIATIITSDADIDDLVNILIATEIEFNKIKNFIKSDQNFVDNIQPKLQKLLGENYKSILNLIATHQGFYIKMVEYQSEKYQLTVNSWWQSLLQKMTIFGIEDTPVYFVSSNLHSILNIAGGYVTAHQPEIYDYLQLKHPDLYLQYQKIMADPSIIRKEDFYYYVSNIYFKNNPHALTKKQIWEKTIGIKNLNLNHDLYCDAQVIPISALATSEFIDPSLNITNKDKLLNSKGVIINIDYPLGYSAYLILSQILKTLNQIKGVYIVGKAAILQGQVGDVQIPSVVFDERLNNAISFDNTFNNNFPTTSKNFSILNNQKAISVQGVILENQSQIDNYLKTKFNIIEMESGSYLSAIASKYNFNGEYPHNQVCKLSNLPFDLGIINYASDNPLSANLGQSAMAMRGIEPAYASLLAIVQRIINLEEST